MKSADNKRHDKKLGYLSSIRFLSRYILPHKRNFLMFYLGWLVITVFGVVLPILFGLMIDAIVYKSAIGLFLRLSLVFVCASLFTSLMLFLIYAQHYYLFTMYIYDIRRDLFSAIYESEAAFLSGCGAGDLVTTLRQYTEECMHFVIRNMVHLSNDVVALLLMGVYIFVIDPRIGALVLLLAPISVFISVRFGKKIRAYSDTRREYYGGYISFLYEVLGAMRDIRLLGAVNKVLRDITSRHKKMYSVDIKSGIDTLTAENIIEGANLFIKLAIFSLAAWLVSRDSMTIGLLAVVMTYFSEITWRVRDLSGSYLDSQNRAGYIQRIHDYLRAPSERAWPGKAKLNVTGGAVRFDKVSFAYEGGSDVLRDLSLSVREGERVALCGESGCGKTTLGYTLLGFYAPQMGNISIDDQKLVDCTLRSIRQNVGMISQDVLLFEGSIRDNLKLGNPRAGEEEMISAMKNAGIYDHVNSLPDGLDTMLGPGGAGLSGGQKQRIAISRVYLRDPRVIIFDEATSSLDALTERQIHEAWRTALQGRTALIIAHRKSSVMLADRAAIMEDGRIVEIGVPSELERRSERFQKLFAIREAESDV